MGWRAVKTVWMKELVDTVRDKRTLYMMVLLPLILMPLITLAGPLLMQRQAEATQQALPPILLVGGEHASNLAERFVAAGIADAAHREALEYVEAERLVSDREFAVVAFVTHRADSPHAPVELEVVVDSQRMASGDALRRIQLQLEAESAQIVAERLAEQGLSTELLEPYRIVRVHNLTTEDDIGARILGMILPFFISMWAVMGGMYTAIDVGAGEKERGTLESLVMAPVSRAALVFGKLLAIATVSFLANLLVIASMVGTIFFLMPKVLGDGEMALSYQIEPLPFVLMLVLMVLFILMLSALLLSLSSFGKSFREGQTYTTALTFAVMIPGMYFAFVEEIHVATWVYAVPIFNVLLILKNLLEGNVVWLNLGVTFASLIVCAALATFAAHRLFLSERIMFRS